MSTLNSPSTDYLQSKIESLKLNQTTHYFVCERHKKRHKRLGLTLVVLSTLSLAFLFFDSSANIPLIEYLPIAVSILVAVISAIVTFVNDNAQAVDHQSSAVAYGALLRECEARVSGAYSETENKEYLTEFQARWQSISATSPLTQMVDRNNTLSNLNV